MLIVDLAWFLVVVAVSTVVVTMGIAVAIATIVVVAIATLVERLQGILDGLQFVDLSLQQIQLLVEILVIVTVTPALLATIPTGVTVTTVAPIALLMTVAPSVATIACVSENPGVGEVNAGARHPIPGRGANASLVLQGNLVDTLLAKVIAVGGLYAILADMGKT